MINTVKKARFNDTTRFILPIILDDDIFDGLKPLMLGIGLFEYFINMGYRNAYLNDHNYPLKDCIYLLFQPETFSKNFKNFTENYLENHKCYKTNYDMEDGKVMYVFSVPEKYTIDIQLLKLGKYSATTKDFKALFPQTIINERGEKVLFSNWMILHKHPFWKKHMETYVGQEIPVENDLWDPLNPIKEIYNYNKDLIEFSW